MSSRKIKVKHRSESPSNKSEEEALLIITVIIIMIKVGLFAEHMYSTVVRALHTFSFVIVLMSQLFHHLHM